MLTSGADVEVARRNGSICGFPVKVMDFESEIAGVMLAGVTVDAVKDSAHRAATSAHHHHLLPARNDPSQRYTQSESPGL
jgi:hypothetical protein